MKKNKTKTKIAKRLRNFSEREVKFDDKYKVRAPLEAKKKVRSRVTSVATPNI